MPDDIVETGLVAAAVTMRAAAAGDVRHIQIKDFKLDDPVPHPDDPRRFDPPAVVAPAMPDGWTLPTVAALVTDVAQNLYDTPYLLKKHKLTLEQFAFLEQNEFFKRALAAETLVWQSTNSIQKRLALEAAIAVEAALPTVAARLSKPTEPLADVVALLKVLSEMAGTIGAKAAGPATSGEKFKIVINMGADVVTREASGGLVSVQSLTEGTGTDRALRALTDGAREEAPLQHQPQG